MIAKTDKRHPPSGILALVCVPFFIALSSGCGKKPAEVVTPADGSAPLVKLTLQTDWYAQPEHGGFYQAVEKGYYREAGLDVNIVQGGPNALPAQKVAMGQAQFGIGRSDDVAIAVGRGIPVVMLGALMQRDPQAIMFHRESGIRGFADLNGRTIMAVPGAGFIPLMEKKYGIKVSITPLDFGLSRFMADKNFVQQCFITNEPFYVRQKGADPGVLLLSDMGFSPYRVWYTSRDFLEKNAEVVRAFTAASIRGWRGYLEGDRAAADARIGSLNKQMVPEFIAFSVAAMKEHKLVTGDATKGETIGQINPQRLESELRMLAEIGVLKKDLKISEVFNESSSPDEVRAR